MGAWSLTSRNFWLERVLMGDVYTALHITTPHRQIQRWTQSAQLKGKEEDRELRAREWETNVNV